jgi:hypothetical protein
MTTVTRSARLRTVLGWPLGIAVVSWRYLWRTVPLHRSEEAGTAADLPGLDYDLSGFAGRHQLLNAGPQISFRNIRTEMNSGSMCGIGGSGLACPVLETARLGDEIPVNAGGFVVLEAGQAQVP